MWTTLRKHAGIAAQIVALFHARFDPHLRRRQPREAREVEIGAAIETALQAVESLDEGSDPSPLRQCGRGLGPHQFLSILDRDGSTKELIAIKFASHKVDAMPLPR